MIATYPALTATLISASAVLLASAILGLPAFERVTHRTRRHAVAAGLVVASAVWGVQVALFDARGVPQTPAHLAIGAAVTAALCCGLFVWYRHYAAGRPALTSTAVTAVAALSIGSGLAFVPDLNFTPFSLLSLVAALAVGWSASWLAGRAARARPLPAARPLALVAAGNGLMIGILQLVSLRFLPNATAPQDTQVSPVGVAVAAAILVAIAASLYSDLHLRRARALDRLVQDRTADLARERDLHVALLGSLNDQVIMCDAHGQLVGYNSGAAELHGRPPIATLAPDWVRAYGLHTPDFARPLELREVPLYRALTGEAVRDTLIGVQRDGERRVVTCNANPIRDREGRIVGAVAAMNDVTDREATREHVRRTASRHAEIIDALDEGLLLLGLDGEILTVNGRALDLLHWRDTAPGMLDDLTGTIDARTTQGAAFASRAESFSRILSGATTVSETVAQVTRRDGSVVWLRSRAQGLYHDGQLTSILYVFADMTDRQRLREELHRVEHFSALTHLPNRAHFQDLCGQHAPTPQRTLLTAQCANISELRVLGRAQAADALAVHFARDLQAAFPDALAFGQLDAQTFAALLPRNVDDVPPALLAPVDVLGDEVFPNVRVGTRAWPDDTPVEAALQEAEAALHAAHDGRVAQFQAAFVERQRRALRTEARLRHALAYLPFTVQYQPIVHLDSGRIVKAEALVRWTDEELGVVPPDEFIPLAERLGQVHRITDHVIEAALAEARRASALLGRPLRIAVNLSPTELNAADFMDRVRALLDRHPDAPGLLAFEVTEGAVLKNLTAAAAILTTLRSLGFGLALDDFGSGYSALGMLQHLPIHHLKLDRTFVWGIEGSGRQQILTRGGWTSTWSPRASRRPCTTRCCATCTARTARATCTAARPRTSTGWAWTAARAPSPRSRADVPHHSATLPSACRHRGLRQRCPVFACSRTCASFTSMPRPTPAGMGTEPSSYANTPRSVT